MKENKLEKLKKLRALSEDSSTTQAERELAYQRYIDFKAKYSLDDIESEERTEKLFIRVKNEYEEELLNYIAYSFGIDTYKEKGCSKLKVVFVIKRSIYIAIEDDYNFHKNNIFSILRGILVKYLHTQVKPPIPVTDGNYVKNDKNFLKAYWGNAWLNDEAYRKKLKLENKS